MPAVHRARRRRAGQVAPRRGVPRSRSAGPRGPPRPLPPLRRGDHVLAGGPGPASTPAFTFRRARRGRARLDRGASPETIMPPRSRPRLAEILGHRRRASAPQETAVGDPSVPRDPRARTASGRGLGGHPLGEPALLDAWITSSTGPATPRSCCCAQRGPEFLDSRPDWGAGKLNARGAAAPTPHPKASTELIANLLGGGRLPADDADRLTEAAGGTRCSSSRWSRC